MLMAISRLLLILSCMQARLPTWPSCGLVERRSERTLKWRRVGPIFFPRARAWKLGASSVQRVPRPSERARDNEDHAGTHTAFAEHGTGERAARSVSRNRVHEHTTTKTMQGLTLPSQGPLSLLRASPRRLSTKTPTACGRHGISNASGWATSRRSISRSRSPASFLFVNVFCFRKALRAWRVLRARWARGTLRARRAV